MALPEDTLQKIADAYLEKVLSRSNEQLLKLLPGMLEEQETFGGVVVHFEFMLEKGFGANAYRAVVYAWDDGPAREEFPVMASADLIFED